MIKPKRKLKRGELGILATKKRFEVTCARPNCNHLLVVYAFTQEEAETQLIREAGWKKIDGMGWICYTCLKAMKKVTKKKTVILDGKEVKQRYSVSISVSAMSGKPEQGTITIYVNDGEKPSEQRTVVIPITAHWEGSMLVAKSINRVAVISSERKRI